MIEGPAKDDHSLVECSQVPPMHLSWWQRSPMFLFNLFDLITLHHAGDPDTSDTLTYSIATDVNHGALVLASDGGFIPLNAAVAVCPELGWARPWIRGPWMAGLPDSLPVQA